MNSSLDCARDVSQGYYYVPLLAIEKLLETNTIIRWMERNWSLSIYFSVIYLVFIHVGQRFMSSRPAFDLRPQLFLWNFSLALFSIFASYRVVPEMVYMIRDYGFASPMCDYGTTEHRETIGIWVVLFWLSKAVEMGDTVFIVLRKQKLLFLHWYHHISVMIFVWYTCAYLAAMCYPFMTFNYIVHSFMYSYFALKALKIKVPRAVSMTITLLQITQMVMGIYVTAFVYLMRARGHSCCASDEAVVAAMVMYGSYLVLFLKFFVDVYWRKTPIERYTDKKMN